MLVDIRDLDSGRSTILQFEPECETHNCGPGSKTRTYTRGGRVTKVCYILTTLYIHRKLIHIEGHPIVRGRGNYPLAREQDR